ncbi:hypothetical protein ANN_09656 [Periplaneta americana]|uniref:Uncharacterized protein n=1 Tax=Periplaneta americana TaxID=6978 RepID=A0ABQ8TPW6_PERAM|nr:hypothetical protein ANN_09656 [Periplaneta americana]
MEHFICMQDGTQPHRMHAFFRVLHEHFGNRVLALYYPRQYDCGLDSPTMSPDINPCDFLWNLSQRQSVSESTSRNRGVTVGN